MHSMENSLIISLLQHNPLDEELTLTYRYINNGKEVKVISLLSNIQFKEKVEVEVTWDESGLFKISVDNQPEIIVQTKIKSPSEYFSISSGSGTFYIDD